MTFLDIQDLDVPEEYHAQLEEIREAMVSGDVSLEEFPVFFASNATPPEGISYLEHVMWIAAVALPSNFECLSLEAVESAINLMRPYLSDPSDTERAIGILIIKLLVFRLDPSSPHFGAQLSIISRNIASTTMNCIASEMWLSAFASIAALSGIVFQWPGCERDTQTTPQHVIEVFRCFVDILSMPSIDIKELKSLHTFILGSFGTIVGDHRVFNAVDDNLLRDIAQLIPEFIGAFNDGGHCATSIHLFLSGIEKLIWPAIIQKGLYLSECVDGLLTLLPYLSSTSPPPPLELTWSTVNLIMAVIHEAPSHDTYCDELVNGINEQMTVSRAQTVARALIKAHDELVDIQELEPVELENPMLNME
eukprot:TRINITY_DN156_c0_g1_i1.p1 TRINITY_DN156_c0_g1~~TRINITY_DN156_c0_g1_i1.p1  ORF type:complete len:364 (+),score=61.23 TRINITY_DN156_c0_g1_i1:34-1125(+)